jgi:hypothetical protein
MITAKDSVGLIKEWPDRITDYLQSFILLIVENISFIDRDVSHIEETNSGE